MKSFPTRLGHLLVTLVLVFNLGPQIDGQIVFPGSSGGGFNSGGNRPRPPFTPRPRPPQPGSRPQPQSTSEGCNCLPQGSCPTGNGQLQVGCVTEGGQRGICCIPQEGAVLTRVGFSPSDFRPINVPNNDISAGFQKGIQFINDMKQDERRLLGGGTYLKRGDPARGHAYFFQRTPSSKAVHEQALTIAQSSKEIANSQSLSPAEAHFGLLDLKIGPTQMGFQCLLREPRCNNGARYRTIDGSCNNPRNSLLGKSETAVKRISPSLYDDGIMSPRTRSVDGGQLPNVRKISSTTMLDVNIPDQEFTLGVMQWAQFIDHDLTLAPFVDMDGEAIMCCENGRPVARQHPQCFNIEVPPSDDFYRPERQTCINFIRSMLALNDNCGFGPVEQLNALTHWLDGSMVYGSTEEQQREVADLSTGLMRVSQNNLPPVNRSVDCEARVERFPCLVGGDSRINEQPALTVVHTLWIREHNRIANTLRQLHPEWDGRTLYEETRRIVVAQIQHITYNEWLPIIIGRNLMRSLGIETLRSGYRTAYNPSIDARISNEFATAAFRFGHSLVQGNFLLYSNSGRQSRMSLRNSFNSPGILQSDPSMVQKFVNGLAVQNIQSMDSQITQELSNHLFQTLAVRHGMDLMSLNLQRGREHGISTYNQMRERFGPGKAQTFFDLLSSTSPDLVKRLQTVYRNVDDIDLFTGGMAEKPVQGGLLGPTFARIVGEQFRDLMNGDRFFYDNGNQAGSFTPDQLQEIRKSSMARIYCDNSDIAEVQALAFSSFSQRNPRQSCSSNNIPSMNLRVF